VTCVSAYAAWSRSSPSYPDRAEFRQEYPEPEDDDSRQALQFTVSNLDDQIIALGAA
jgi:hypothetical protein